MTAHQSYHQDRTVRSEMQGGDLLLSRGDGNTAEWITYISNCRYSHAALWTGNEIVETGIGSGVTLQPLESEMEAQRYVDVYRWRTRNEAKELGDNGYPPGPVIEAAKELKGKPFDTASSGMLALIVAISEIGRERFGPVLRGAISEIWRWFQDRRGEGQQQRAMICTESVCTAFWNAKQNTTTDYGIHIEMAASRLERLRDNAERRTTGRLPMVNQVEGLKDPDIQCLAAEIFLNATQSERSVAEAVEELDRRSGGRGVVKAAHSLSLEVGERGLPLCCVTPHDLGTSPSFRFVGHLSWQKGVQLPNGCPAGP